MATSSYQIQNSYDELKYRPYELDYSSILKEASAKTSYWMEGAAKIQQAYSKITGLNPQFKQNKEALNSFNSQVKDQIKKLAGTDLGIQGNANQINNIIAPLYDTSNNTSKAIILDDSYNKAGQSLMKEIENYKTKDKGIHYSQDNEEYAMGWYKKYMKKAQDPNASLKDLEELRGEIKGYTPYYDASQEIKTAIEKCPENKSSRESIQGYYKTNSTEISKNSSDCIQAFLSDKAKNQFNIEGYVKYGKNYEALGNHMVMLSKGSLDQYNKQLGEVGLKLSDKKLTDNERQSYETVQKSIQSEIDKINTLTSKVGIKDFSDIEANYEQYAGQVYYQSKIKSFEAFNKKPEDNLIQSINPDMVGLTLKKLEIEMAENERQRQFDAQQNVYKEGNANYRANLKEEGDYARAGMTKDGKKIEPIPESTSFETATGETDVVMDKASFLSTGQGIATDLEKSEVNLANYIVSKYGKDSKISANNRIQRETFVKGILANNAIAKNDLSLQSMLKEYKDKKLYYTLWSTENNRIKEQIKNEVESNAKPIIVETVDGKKYSIDPKNFRTNLSFTPFASQGGAGVAGFVKLTDAKGNVTKTLPIKYAESIYDKTKTFDMSEEKYYKTAITPNTLWTSNENRNLAKQDKNPDPIRQRLSTILTGIPADTEGKKNITYEDIKIGRNNLNGDVEILLPVTATQSQIEKQLRASFKSENIVNKGNGKYVLKGIQEFKDPLANDVVLGSMLSRIMTNIQETPYNIHEEIPIINDYNNRFNIYTKKSTPGLIYIYDKKEKGVPYTETNISKVIDYLKGIDTL